MLATVFILAITDEYSDTFVLSSVKNTVENEISRVALSQPGCSNTSLVWMRFSKATSTIDLNISGCQVDLSKVAGIVETKVCNARSPTGGNTLVCSGTTYTINRV
jgi:hypothetical protein